MERKGKRSERQRGRGAKGAEARKSVAARSAWHHASLQASRHIEEGEAERRRKREGRKGEERRGGQRKRRAEKEAKYSEPKEHYYYYYYY